MKKAEIIKELKTMRKTIDLLLLKIATGEGTPTEETNNSSAPNLENDKMKGLRVQLRKQFYQ